MSLSPRPDNPNSTTEPGAAPIRRQSGDSVRRLERRQNAFRASQQPERCQRLRIGGRGEFQPAIGRQRGKLRTDAWVVEPGRDRMCFAHLAVTVLQEHRSSAVDDADAAGAHRRGMPAGFDTLAGRLDRDQSDAWLADEPTEKANGIRSATHAGGHDVRQAPFDARHLGGGLVADYALEIAHDGWVWVRPHRGSKDVVAVTNVGDPIAYRVIDRVLERRRARFD